MTIKYLPIFKAKRGEFQAVANAKMAHARGMLPLFEVSRMGEKLRNAARFKDRGAVTCAYLDEIVQRIAQVREGKEVLVDAFQWPAESTTETGEHILTYIYSRLQSLGVGVVPVIGYDRWDSHSYRIAMQGVELSADGYCCLRLDSHAIEDAKDTEFFEDRLFGILADLRVEPGRCAVLLDFGDITALSVEDLVDQAERVMQILAPMAFKFFATAGCSLPPTIDKAVKKQNSTGKILRKEMLLWQTLRIGYPNVKWLFGDYGIRGPGTAEDVVAPDTNGKIRHTISKSYYIVRGHSMRTGDKGAQMHKLAKEVVDSSHFRSEDFSWGDAQILVRSQRETEPGNSTDWIAIDTNHHLALVVTEIEEFELKVTAETSVI